MSKVLFLLVVFVCAISTFGQDVTQGSLFAYGKQGKDLGACPLKNTAVKAEISGFLARVRVKQEFQNSFSEPIEAIYTFPLSQKGAVDEMTMTVGTRTIRGKIMKREEAREVYEQAKSQGQAASLLDQERPNIFTQSVANIMPGESIVIEISYIETLNYEDGAYEFVFPMTVGPRYIPARITDAPKISPPIAIGRPGHDISIEVNLNAGVPVEEIRSTSHEIQQLNLAPNRAQVTLKSGTVIPNKDFILRYDVTGGKIQDAVLTHRGERGGFFTMILQPPDKIANEDRTPKEIVFVLDTSGSMGGFPIEKAKEAMRLSLEGLYPDDTFNFITFAGDTHVLFEEPVPATQANVSSALAFLESRTGGGGTEMMKAIKAALDPSDAKDHLRIVCFMTDGYVGNEAEIIGEVQRHPNARVFSFGIGNSVNRYLLDKMAEAGKGEVEYVSLTDDGSKAARRFYERVRTPLLTDLSIDWNGLPVEDVYPSRLTDLFSAKPVIIHGRYSKPFVGTARLRGKVAGQDYSREIAINLLEAEPANDALGSLWARTRVDELTSARLEAKDAASAAAVDKQILELGLDYRLMTSLTSFVAVENRVVNQNGKPVTIQVPVGMADGVDPAKSGTNVSGSDISTEFFSNIPTSRTAQGLHTVAPGVARSGIRDASRAGGGGGGGRRKDKSYGDPNARYARMSNGTGSGGGQGTGFGYGQGQASTYGTGAGSGSGSGNGSGGAPPAVAVAKVTIPLRIISKPQAKYTEDARTNNVQGSVRLKVVLLASGQVGSITPVTQLPHGLTEQAIAAARLLKFEPAKVNGVPVSKTITIDYSFPADGTEAAGGPIWEQAVAVARPDFSAVPASVKREGEIAVDIEVDSDGNVVTANAVSGTDELRPAVVEAAKLTRFIPVFSNGTATSFRGTILYKLASPEHIEVVLTKFEIVPPNEADKLAFDLARTAHVWVYAAAMRVSKGIAEPTPNESKFVRDGKASVRIELNQNADQFAAKLRQAGLEIESIKKQSVIGRIALDKLGALTEIKQVVYIAPRL